MATVGASSSSSSGGTYDGPSSPVGSPSRALLSRLSYSTSPRASPYPRGEMRSASPLAAARSPTSSPPSAAQMRQSCPSPSPTAHARTHPFSHGLEAAGENHPYFLAAKDVTLADKYIKDEGCERLVHELLGRGTDLSVVSLDLRGNDIRRRGAEAIGELMLRDNCGVESLNLEWNFLGDSGGAGLEALTDALKTNNTLTTLDLRNNRLNSECGVYLARLLLCNRTLQHLDLRWNNLSVNGGAALADALVRNHTLRTLALSGNRIPSGTIKAIEEALAKNRQGLPHPYPHPKPSDADLDLRARAVDLEQQVHDLERELAHTRAQSLRQETELTAEARRCDELTAEVGTLRDRLDVTAAATAKQVGLLTLDLEQARQQLHDTCRAADADGLALKQAQLDLMKVTGELRVVTEDRARLLVSRDSQTSQLQGQIEKLHAELGRAHEQAHARERAFQEERDGFDNKLAHQRRMAESEREAALTQLTERNRSLGLENARMKDEGQAQLGDLYERIRTLSTGHGDANALVLSLREQLLVQGVKNEEAMAKLEALRAQDAAAGHVGALREVEARLVHVQRSRDELERAHEALQARDALLQAQIERERAEHAKVLEQERARGNEAAALAASTQHELYGLKTRVLEAEHRGNMLAAQVATHASESSANAARHAKEVEAVYGKTGVELQAVLRDLRRAEEDKARLRDRLRALEARLAATEAEQQLRSASLATALSAIKNVVDENVATAVKPHHSSSSTSSRRHQHSSSHHTHRSERERDRESHRDRDRDREREREREREHRDRREQRHDSAHRARDSHRGATDRTGYEDSSLTPRQASASPTSARRPHSSLSAAATPSAAGRQLSSPSAAARAMVASPTHSAAGSYRSSLEAPPPQARPQQAAKPLVAPLPLATLAATMSAITQPRPLQLAAAPVQVRQQRQVASAEDESDVDGQSGHYGQSGGLDGSVSFDEDAHARDQREAEHEQSAEISF